MQTHQNQRLSALETAGKKVATVLNLQRFGCVVLLYYFCFVVPLSLCVCVCGWVALNFRKQLQACWNAYTKAVVDRQSIELLDKPVGATIRADPLLACRAYERCFKKTRQFEGDFSYVYLCMYTNVFLVTFVMCFLCIFSTACSKQMSRLYREFRTTDGRRIDGTKTVMLDQLLAQKALLEHSLQVM